MNDKVKTNGQDEGGDLNAAPETNMFDQMVQDFNNVGADVGEPPKDASKEGEGDPAAAGDPAPEPKAPQAEGDQPPAKVEGEEGSQPEAKSGAPEDPKPADPKQLTAEELQAQNQQQIEDMQKAYREQYAKLLVGDHFMEEQQALVADLLAQSQVNGYMLMMNVLSQQAVPMIMGVMQQQQAAQKLETAFYEKWPKLNAPEYQETIAQYSQMIRQQNPDITPDEMITKVGAAACAVHSLNPADVSAPVSSDPAPNTAPAVTDPNPAPQPLRNQGGQPPPQPAANAGKEHPINSEGFFGDLVDVFDPTGVGASGN